jgi:hypothetical protein
MTPANSILFSLLGSPFSDKPRAKLSDQELLNVYDIAFKDRVALLYLSLHRRPDWDPQLEEKYQVLKSREEMTLQVISTLAETLNKWNPNEYVIFKSIKPYPATPNDTDMICLSDARGYEEMYEHVLKSGYTFHEWAPQQRSVYDARGKGKIGKGKKGGTYYIDLYSEISTDYFSYMNKHRLREHVVTREIHGVPVKLLRPEPELAIVMFHSVFPERTFQLEHFFVPLHTLAKPEFSLDLFLKFSKEAGVSYAVRAQASMIAWLHQKHFGSVPKPIQEIIDRLGANEREVSIFARREGQTPYMFSPRTFWTAFAYKTLEWHSFKSLMWQGSKMLNPKFFMDVMRSIKLRMSEKGAYGQD